MKKQYVYVVNFKSYLLFFVLLFLLALITNIRSSENIKEIGIEQFACPKYLTLISSEGIKYAVPFVVAMQSEFIKTAWEYGKEKELKVGIPNEYLRPLVKALAVINHYRCKSNSKQLYTKVQGKLWLTYKYSLEKIINLFNYSIELDSDYLTNAIADYISQVVDNKNAFNVCIRFIHPEHWPLIEKYYYLRSDELRVHFKNLLFKNNNKLTELLFDTYFEESPQEFNIENIGKQIIYNMNLSIQDLLDYGKKIENIIRYNKIIFDLSYYSLRSLDGINNINGIKNIERLDISRNLLKELHVETLSGLENIVELYIGYNQLSELPLDIFKCLNNITKLHIEENPWGEFPQEVFILKNLRTLTIDFSQYKDINVVEQIKELYPNIKLWHTIHE